MQVIYLDCFSGISGDMFLGALFDAGLDFNRWEKEIKKIPLTNYRIKLNRVRKNGIGATSYQMELTKPEPTRTLSDVLTLLQESELRQSAKNLAARVFRRLAAAEAVVHRVPPEKAHFHEVGATDAVIDIAGTAVALDLLGIKEVYSSKLPLGTGWVECAHGRLPIPAPATVELLRGFPVYRSNLEGELVTPTGAALVTTLTSSTGPIPPLTIEKAGYGAGTRDTEHPNLLRILIGRKLPQTIGGCLYDTVYVVETSIDDMNPEWYRHLRNRLTKNGALDVYITPLQNKKERPGHLLTVIMPDQQQSLDTLASIIFQESTTIGLRYRRENRLKLHRRFLETNTPYGMIKVKVGFQEGPTPNILNIAPELDDCEQAALSHRVPLKTVYYTALYLAQQFFKENPLI